jgi:hypothetical protein
MKTFTFLSTTDQNMTPFSNIIVAGLLVGLSNTAFFNLIGFTMITFLIVLVSLVVFVLSLIYFKTREQVEESKNAELIKLRELNWDVKL